MNVIEFPAPIDPCDVVCVLFCNGCVYVLVQIEGERVLGACFCVLLDHVLLGAWLIGWLVGWLGGWLVGWLGGKKNVSCRV